MKRRLVGLYSSFVNNGVSDPHNVILKRTAHLSNTYGLIIFAYMTILGVQVSLAGDRWLAAFDFVIAGLLVINFVALRFTNNVTLSAHVTLSVLAAALVFLTVTGGKGGTGPLWCVIFPTISMQLKGHRAGTVYSALFITVVFTILVFFRDSAWVFPYDAAFPNAPVIISRLLLICVGLSLMSYSFARNRSEMQEEIERMSLTDVLTGLPNRRFINQMIEAAASDFKRRSYGGRAAPAFSLILCDVDNFKKINDTHGHLAGDQALKAISRILRRTLRESDFIGRWGGEEFLVLLRDTALEQAEIVCKKLQSTVRGSELQLRDDLTIQTTMSFGISCYNVEQDMESFIANLDNKLYTAKNRGRDCVVID